MERSHAVTKNIEYIRGAAFGQINKTHLRVIQEINERSPTQTLNHSPKKTYQQMKQELCGLSPTSKDWQQLPWSERQISLNRLFCSVIAFTDDHSASIHDELFPIDLSHEYINEVLNKREHQRAPLTIAEQFKIALELSDDKPTAAAILAHSASRAIGRNRDERIHPSFKFEKDIIARWSESLTHFQNQKHVDPMGDTYHFWATCAMGMTIATAKSLPGEKELYTALFNNGAHIMVVARNVIANRPLRFIHKEVDRIGLKTGIKLGKDFIKNK